MIDKSNDDLEKLLDECRKTDGIDTKWLINNQSCKRNNFGIKKVTGMRTVQYSEMSSDEEKNRPKKIK